MARPFKHSVNWKLVDSLIAIQCTKVEICGVLGMSDDTLSRHCKEKFQINYAEYYEQKSAVGKVSLRRRQWKSMEAGDRTMLIWLGKNILGQTDKVEQTGTTTVVNEYAGVSTKDLEERVRKLQEQLKGS